MLLGKLFFTAYIVSLGSNEPDMCLTVSRIIASGNHNGSSTI